MLYCVIIIPNPWRHLVLFHDITIKLNTRNAATQFTPRGHINLQLYNTVMLIIKMHTHTTLGVVCVVD